MTGVRIVTVAPGEEEVRADRFLAEKVEGLSRSAVQKLMDAGRITLGGKPLAANHKTRRGDEYRVEIPPPEPTEAEAEAIPLDIVYEDGDIVIVNKAAGMVVHPAKGHFGGTLVNALLHGIKDLSGIGGEMRPGIVHRLDKDTTGLIAVAKNDAAHASLSDQLRSRQMGREYLAVVRGHLAPPSGTIDKPIGRHHLYRKKMTVNPKKSEGREAVTLYETVERFADCALVRVKLKTGRTHQIRVHFSAIGHPIMGDAVYGKGKTLLIARPALHAARLSLVHPSSGKTMTFEAPLPEDFSALLIKLRGNPAR
ncbi:MAG: RluA family pseudouridine synthase [Nitrospinae bacterium]|nr:RluA family pseudouridine synthase [Nitrospinota bacterium]